MTNLKPSQTKFKSKTQLQAAALLELRRRQKAISGGDEITFRGAARTAQTITDKLWFLSGPAETGKTFAGLYRLDSEVRKYPNSQWLIICKVRASMRLTVLKTWSRIITMRGGVTEMGGTNPELYVYENGAKVWVVGMDSPDKILSGEFWGAYINQAEALTLDDLDVLTTRVTGRGTTTETPMVFGDCNPGPADHWIKRKSNAGDITLLESKHRDNPTLYTDDGELTAQGERTMAVLQGLSGTRRLRLYLGLWVGAEGQFFEQWDELIHVREPDAYVGIPADWEMWGAFDYGFTHNTAFGVFVRYDNQIELIGEHVANKLLPSQHAPAMDALLQRLGISRQRLRTIVAGHDVFVSKGDSKGDTIAEQYAALGYTFERAQIDRINGAAQLLSRLGNTTTTPKIAPTFKVWRRCPRAIATIPAMVHDPKRPEDVLKVDAQSDGTGGDDAYDMVRYGLMYSRLRSGWSKEDMQAFKQAGR